MSENESIIEKQEGYFERKLPRGSLRRGIFYIALGVSGATGGLVGGAYFLLGQGTAMVANELEPTISQQGTNLNTTLNNQINPTKDDVERMARQADELVKSFKEFQLAACRAGLDMESCDQILLEAGIDPARVPGSVETAAPGPSVVIPTPQMTTTP